MSDASETPDPPIQAGTPASVPKAAIGLGGSARAAIRDITSLIGEDLFKERIETRGQIGYTSTVSTGDGGVALADVNRVRNPFVLTCQKWIEGGKYIVCNVNPKDISWRMPQRSAVQKTRRGEIMHIWRDRFRGTFYDEPQISINFQSGNIMPIRRKPLTTVAEQVGVRQDEFGNTVGVYQEKSVEAQEGVEVPRGLDNFYQFLSLVDEQKILKNGQFNFCYILYNSRMFPNLTLMGLFTPEGVSWSDSSDDPNQVNNWSANFTIYDSYPSLNNLESLRQFFRDAGWGRV